MANENSTMKFDPKDLPKWSDIEAAGTIDVGFKHLGGLLGHLADLGDVPGHRDVEADLDSVGCKSRGREQRDQ